MHVGHCNFAIFSQPGASHILSTILQPTFFNRKKGLHHLELTSYTRNILKMTRFNAWYLDYLFLNTASVTVKVQENSLKNSHFPNWTWILERRVKMLLLRNLQWFTFAVVSIAKSNFALFKGPCGFLCCVSFVFGDFSCLIHRVSHRK